MQQPHGDRRLPAWDQPKLEAVLRRDGRRPKRGNAQVLAAGIRADDPFPVLLGIVEDDQRNEFRCTGGIPGNDRQGGEEAATIQPT
jgi:hypothetical protein